MRPASEIRHANQGSIFATLAWLLVTFALTIGALQLDSHACLMATGITIPLTLGSLIWAWGTSHALNKNRQEGNSAK